MRRDLARQQGEAMRRAGVRAGNKPFLSNSKPNMENYRDIMAGMGKRLVKTDSRHIKH